MTTPQETLDVACAYSRAFNDRAFDRLQTILDPDIVDESIAGQIIRTGVDAVSESLQGATRARPDTQIQIANAFATEDQALLKLRMIATDSKSGQQLALPARHVYRIRNGKIIRRTTYSDCTSREPGGAMTAAPSVPDELRRVAGGPRSREASPWPS